MMKAKRKNNKGFTLVEMIIVIAVMSILAIVVSPQLISYIEKARRGTDRQAIWEAAHAAQVAYAAQKEDIGDQDVMVSITADDGIVSYRTEEKLDAEVEMVLPADSYKYKSELYRGSEIMITIDDNGVVYISSTAALDRIQDEIDLKQARLERATARLNRARQQYTLAQVGVETVEYLLSIGESGLNTAKTNLQNRKNDIVEIEKQIKNKRDTELQPAQRELEAAQAEYEAATGFIGKGLAWLNVESKQSKVDRINREINNLETRRTNYANTITALEQAVQQRQNGFDATQADLREANEKLEAAKKEVDDAILANDAASKELDEAWNKLEDQRDIAADLDEHIHEVTGTSTGKEE